jgi:hypothetical protein
MKALLRWLNIWLNVSSSKPQPRGDYVIHSWNLSGGIDFGFQHGFGRLSLLIPIIEILNLFLQLRITLMPKRMLKAIFNNNCCKKVHLNQLLSKQFVILLDG